MIDEIKTHCDVRLGDNLAHLHFLRALAKQHPEIQFRHAAHLCYIPQLIEVACDLPNLSLHDIRRHEFRGSHNAWKNEGRFWERHELKNEYGPFMLEFFGRFARKLGLKSPFSEESDLLFDYPAIKDSATQPFDFLVVNSEPMSGQCASLDLFDLDNLVLQLSERYKVMTTRPVKPWIPCTQSHRLSVTGVGGISRNCRFIVMVSTGVSWATFNVWNKKSVEKRIIILEHERINIAPNSVNVNTVGLAREILKDFSIL